MLSARLLAFGTFAQCQTVLLHEIAHAIVFRQSLKTSPHGNNFRLICQELGVKADRLLNIEAERWTSRERYAAQCDRCGDLVLRRRLIRRMRCSCGRSFEPTLSARVAVGKDLQLTLIGYVKRRDHAKRRR